MSPDLPPVAAAAAIPALDITWGGEGAEMVSAGGDTLRLDRTLIIQNSGPDVRVFDAMAELVPELVDTRGKAVALPGGRNRAAPPMPIVIRPGGRAEIPVGATLYFIDGGIKWRGDDGLGGRWESGDFSGRYRLRLRLGNSTSPALALKLSQP